MEILIGVLIGLVIGYVIGHRHGTYHGIGQVDKILRIPPGSEITSVEYRQRK